MPELFRRSRTDLVLDRWRSVVAIEARRGCEDEGVGWMYGEADRTVS